jgi:hypothetical protein
VIQESHIVRRQKYGILGGVYISCLGVRVKSEIFIMGCLVAVFGFFSGCASMSETRSCTPTSVEYGPSDFKVQVSKYEPLDKSLKSIIIVPPTGGTNYIDRSYAEKFCAEGYDVYIMNHWTGDSEMNSDLEIHQILYARAQKAISITISEIETPFVGLLGTSLGALHGSVAANTQERLNAVFLIVGGAPITEAIVTSDQNAMRNLKEERKKRFGFKNDEDYLAALKKAFLLEPMAQGSVYKRKDIGMVQAEKDETVPYALQLKLQTFFNPKKSFTLPSSHFWAIVKTWFFHTSEVVEFFNSSAKERKK